MANKLNNTEAEIIYDLYREQGYVVDEPFTSLEAFPGDSPEAQKLRGVVEGMAMTGKLGITDGGMCLTGRSLRMYDEWARDPNLSPGPFSKGKGRMSKAVELGITVMLVMGVLLGGCVKQECWTVGASTWTINAQTGEAVQGAPVPHTVCGSNSK